MHVHKSTLATLTWLSLHVESLYRHVSIPKYTLVYTAGIAVTLVVTKIREHCL